MTRKIKGMEIAAFKDKFCILLVLIFGHSDLNILVREVHLMQAHFYWILDLNTY